MVGLPRRSFHFISLHCFFQNRPPPSANCEELVTAAVSAPIRVLANNDVSRRVAFVDFKDPAERRRSTGTSARLLG